jgi:hypothetical protein
MAKIPWSKPNSKPPMQAAKAPTKTVQLAKMSLIPFPHQRDSILKWKALTIAAQRIGECHRVVDILDGVFMESHPQRRQGRDLISVGCESRLGHVATAITKSEFVGSEFWKEVGVSWTGWNESIGQDAGVFIRPDMSIRRTRLSRAAVGARVYRCNPVWGHRGGQ